MSEREEKFERMLKDTQKRYKETCERLAVLKSEDKTKTATYRQLLSDKMQLKSVLILYKIYGLADFEE